VDGFFYETNQDLCLESISQTTVHRHYKTKPHSFSLSPNASFLCIFTQPPLFMNNTAVSDTSGVLPPVTKSEIDGVGGPTIKINVSYGSSLHEIHLPAQSTFGQFLFFLSLFIHEIIFYCFKV